MGSRGAYEVHVFVWSEDIVQNIAQLANYKSNVKVLMGQVKCWGSPCSSGQEGETPGTGLDGGGSFDSSEPNGDLTKESAWFDVRLKGL